MLKLGFSSQSSVDDDDVADDSGEDDFEEEEKGVEADVDVEEDGTAASAVSSLCGDVVPLDELDARRMCVKRGCSREQARPGRGRRSRELLWMRRWSRRQGNRDGRNGAALAPAFWDC